jgi:hypothetical protein
MRPRWVPLIGLLLLGALLLAACNKKETPPPSTRIKAAHTQFRSAAAAALKDAAKSGNVNVSTDGFTAASVGAGGALIAVAPIDGAERLDHSQLSAGANVLLVYVPTASTPSLPANFYTVRVRNDASANTWRAQFIGLAGDEHGEVTAAVDEPAGASPTPGCRASVGRGAGKSDLVKSVAGETVAPDIIRGITARIACGTYNLGLAIGEDVNASSRAPSSAAGNLLSEANDAFRSAVNDALCDEARAWSIRGCPSDFIIGSRNDSLAVSAPIGSEATLRTTQLDSGVDLLFTYLELPSDAGVPAGFFKLRRSADVTGAPRMELKTRTGEIAGEPATTVFRHEAGEPRAPTRYVSYQDDRSVCLDLDIPVQDVTSGDTWVETDIACFGSQLGTTTTSEETTTSSSATTSTPRSSTTRTTTRATTSSTAAATTTVAATTTTEATTTMTEATTTTSTTTP